MNSCVYACRRPAARRVLSRILLPLAGTAIFTVALAPAPAQRLATPAAELSQPPLQKPLLVPGHVVIPSSSIPVQGATGKAHTNVRLFQPDNAFPDETPPYGGYAYETPESLACVYGLVAAVAGCNPNVTVNVPSGGSGIIAIVDAYDDPEAAPDLAWFSLQFGIPLKVSQFQVVYASGFQPPVDYTGGWEMEESLDIEYAHAMAPSATIYLVEANSNSYSDLFTAVTVATNIIQCGNFSSTIGACTTVTGHGEVSMSWGSGEFAGETAYDTYFNQKNVVFLASSGDQPGPSYPATSPNVIAVGGTSTGRSLATGNTEWQTVWQDAGSGPSAYEAKPSYQSAITLASSRMTPDVAADANPATGVWVYDSFPTDGYFYSSSWWILGGTSVAAPVWAGILNNADTRHSTVPANTAAELTTLYTASASYFYDVHGTGATCGFYDTYAAGTGYDLCTGLGAPWTYNGK